MVYRRKTFLINKPFQLRFAFYVSSWLVALSFGFPLMLSNTFGYFFHILVLDPHSPAVAELQQTKTSMMWLLAFMEIVLVSLAFLISIFMSHRIAGPLDKLKRAFREAKDGNYNDPIVFRKYDYFQDLALGFNTMIASIRSKSQKQEDAVRQAIEKLDGAVSLASPETRSDIESALYLLRNSSKNE